MTLCTRFQIHFSGYRGLPASFIAMNFSIPSYPDRTSPYALLFESLSLIPISHYLLASAAFIVVCLYNFLEWHSIEDALGGFRGQLVTLTFNPDSEFYNGVVSKCKILRGRYFATPWLASPHFQTTFLNFFGRPPPFTYRRKIFRASDGGTIALDWLLNSDVVKGTNGMSNEISKDDQTPLVIVVPGLTSDSNSAYLKHLVYNTAKCGWNVVVSNHRGLGGVSVTSDCFYNAGWTEDIRVIIHHLHNEYPSAPLYVIGTSIGANVLVKYLGEDGDDVPIVGAVAICSPWDLLIGDRFIGRRLVQTFYDRALAIGLQGYARLHQPQFSRLANWEGILKSRSIRDFDKHATVIVGKYETVDTYYRRCSSASFVGKVSVPLLCISALDDPLCTREAIPWDECRLNKNIVLATTKHGGHLAFFEGVTASGLWWVRASVEFLGILNQSPFVHAQRKMKTSPPPEPSIDHGPFVNVAQDGMVAALANEQTPNTDEICSSALITPNEEPDHGSSLMEQDEVMPESKSSDETPADAKNTEETPVNSSSSSFIMKRLNQLSRHSRRSMWLLVYISIASSWPLVGSAIYFFFRRRIKNIPRNTAQRR